MDACTPDNDANCNGNDNDGCECIIGLGNGACSDDPNASRCNEQGQCAPCQTSDDCSLVQGGLTTCEAGTCVAPAPPLSCDALGDVRQAPVPPFTQSEEVAPAPTGGVIEDGIYVTTQVRIHRVDNVGSVLGETIEFRNGTFSRNSTTYSSISGEALAGAITAGTFGTTGTSLAVEGLACSVGGTPRTAEIWGYSVTNSRLELHRRNGQTGVLISVFAKQ